MALPEFAAGIGPATWAIVAVLALVQSWFGVGLLLLGTPLLLLAGTPFRMTLWVLLPASLTVSVLQLLTDRLPDPGAAGQFFRWAVPALVVGLAVVILLPPDRPHIDLFVAATLAASGVLRLAERPARALRALARRHEAVMLMGIGLLHGLTNMGGGLLSAYASSRHVEKYAVRQHVALGYAILAAVQLILLAAADGYRVNLSTLPGVGIAGLVFLTIGRSTFRRFSQPAFHVALSVFMLSMATLLVVRSVR